MKSPKTPDRLEVTRLEARKLLGIADRSFSRAEADGVIVPLRRGAGRLQSTYDLAAIVPAYVAWLRNSTTSGDREARARRDRSQADLNELRLRHQRSELLPRAQVVRDGRAFVLATKAKLLALPRRLAQAGIIPAAQQAATAELLREALEEMARWSSAIDLRKAANAAEGEK